MSITSLSTASIPNAMAGKLSVTRFIHSNCIDKNSVLCHKIIARNTETTSPIFVPSKKPTTFLILAYIPRPSRTASTIVAKLSSVRVISAAPFATSVPVMPIAQPMSAALSAGASFTPSPVIATT